MRYGTLTGVLATALLIAFLPATILAQRSGKTPEASVPLVIPDEERNRENPFPADDEALEYGEVLFQSQCAMCHGKQGDGNGDLAAQLKLEVPSFREASRMRERTDGELHYVLTHGHGSMPAEGERLGEKAKWNMISYIRTLAGS